MLISQKWKAQQMKQEVKMKESYYGKKANKVTM